MTYWNDTEGERAEELAEAEQAARDHAEHVKRLYRMKMSELVALETTRMREYGMTRVAGGPGTKGGLIASILELEAAIAAEAILAAKS